MFFEGLISIDVSTLGLRELDLIVFKRSFNRTDFFFRPFLDFRQVLIFLITFSIHLSSILTESLTSTLFSTRKFVA